MNVKYDAQHHVTLILFRHTPQREVSIRPQHPVWSFLRVRSARVSLLYASKQSDSEASAPGLVFPMHYREIRGLDVGNNYEAVTFSKA